jgi:sarcosine oxidase/L-pipecolate oxidase
VPAAAFDGCTGYLNRDGGWVDAGKSLTLLLRKIEDLGGKIFPAKQVSHLIRHKESKDKASHGARKIIGIQCSDGTLVHAELVIVATGSWTQSTFPELGLGKICIATG